MKALTLKQQEYMVDVMRQITAGFKLRKKLDSWEKCIVFAIDAQLEDIE